MIPIYGADPRYATALYGALGALPPWYVAAGRLSRVVVTPDPDVRRNIAMYAHGAREIRVAPGVGSVLQKALAHEIGHAIDDWAEEAGNPHVFSTTEAWVGIHRNQTHFDLPTYRADPREHFADMMAKAILVGVQKLALAAPREAAYLSGFVFPALQQQNAGQGA
jgi:hypothetical protein